MKTIPEFPNYKITEEGLVWSEYLKGFLSPYDNGKGYLCVKLHKDGVQYTYALHRLLARVYKELPSLDSDMEVDHKDRNRQNISLENLQVLTKEQHLLKTLSDRNHKLSGIEKSTICPTCLGHKDPFAKQCRSCANNSQIKDITISAEQIEYWVSNYSWTRAGKELGYSDNGLRKRYKSLTGKDPKSIKRI